MTAPDQPKAPPTQRVSDEHIAREIEVASAAFNRAKSNWAQNNAAMTRDIALDLRDTRAALAAKDARIAELEAEGDKLLGDWQADNAEIVHLRARADRLKAQLQAARAAGPDDLPTEIATSFCCEPLVRQLCEMKARLDYPNADKWGFAENATSNMGDLHGLLQEHALKAIRARLRRPSRSHRRHGREGMSEINLDTLKRTVEAVVYDDSDSARLAHIAACDPPTVLALIARLRAAEARADDAERRGWIMGRDAAIAALGCPVCSGDCGAANPQVAHCPVRALTPPQEPSTNG